MNIFSPDPGPSPGPSGIRHISETARWAAVYRARESERADALFQDPWARPLAGNLLDAALPFHADSAWSWSVRTVIFDHFIEEQTRLGMDMVVNLAAGLDTRPYRMNLPSSLTWVEVDLPEILAYKSQVLGSAPAVCVVERVCLDLTDVQARRTLFAALGRRTQSALIVSEGLLIYLTEEQVGGLAADLSGSGSFRRWVLDLLSPGLLKIVRETSSPSFSQGIAAPQFAPVHGPQFFVPHLWRPVAVASLLDTAAELGRLPPALAHFTHRAKEPERTGTRPWSGVCLFEHG